MQIKISVRNIDKVNIFFKAVARFMPRAATKPFAEYIIGDSNHGLSHDDPYQQTTRAKVYGRQWESDKQRRFVMGAIQRGEIILGQRKYSPTRASSGYKLHEQRDGYAIINTQPGAFWSRVWAKWPRWRHYNEVVRSNMRGAILHTVKEMNRWLRSK